MNPGRHTPDPWTAERDSEGRWEINSSGPQWSAIATVQKENTLGSRPVTYLEANANARLIITAPRMLRKLRDLLTEYEDRASAECYRKIGDTVESAELAREADDIRDIISAATGRPR